MEDRLFSYVHSSCFDWISAGVSITTCFFLRFGLQSKNKAIIIPRLRITEKTMIKAVTDVVELLSSGTGLVLLKVMGRLHRVVFITGVSVMFKFWRS
jgi:hypothetical protein